MLNDKIWLVNCINITPFVKLPNLSLRCDWIKSFCIERIKSYSKSYSRHSCNLKVLLSRSYVHRWTNFSPLFDNNNVWFINNLSLLSSKCMLIGLFLIWWWLCHEKQLPKMLSTNGTITSTRKWRKYKRTTLFLRHY